MAYFAIRGRSIRLANEAYENSPDRFFTFNFPGDLLSEYGISEGQEIKVFYNQQCQSGDLCYVDCLIDKCKLNGNTKFINQIKYIQNSCYWFQGKTLPKTENGKVYTSFDSRDFGLLCPGEFKELGVVK